MDKETEQTTIRTGNGADLAFAVVVLTAYFVTFSTLHTTNQINILAMIGLGMAYIATGIYGYAYCAQSANQLYSIIYFSIQTIIGGWIVYLGKGTGPNLLILLPLTGHCVILLRSYWIYLMNVIILTAYALALFSFSGSMDYVIANVPNFLAGQVFIVSFVQMAVGEERARKKVEQLVKTLSDANEKLREYADQVEALTLTKERARVAREIHDGLGHYLTTINMQLQAAQAVINKDKKQAVTILTSAQMMTKEALAEVRRSVFDLREAIDYSDTLVEKIIKTTANAGLFKVESDFAVQGEPRHLRPAVELALYRAVQEGVSNIYKHAGASKMWINLYFDDPEYIMLEIKDNGSGSTENEEGFGLRGLQERIGLLNGRINIESNPGIGFILKVIIPG